MDEIARDGGQRGEAVCQRLEDGAGHERPALHVTRRYVTANCRLRRNFCGPQPHAAALRAALEILASPKSSNLTVVLPFTPASITLPGFRSRCTMSCRC